MLEYILIIKDYENLNNNNLSPISFGLRYLRNETDPSFDKTFTDIFGNEYYGVQGTYLHFSKVSV